METKFKIVAKTLLAHKFTKLKTTKDSVMVVNTKEEAIEFFNSITNTTIGSYDVKGSVMSIATIKHLDVDGDDFTNIKFELVSVGDLTNIECSELEGLVLTSVKNETYECI